jgi:hypothetical protein
MTSLLPDAPAAHSAELADLQQTFGDTLADPSQLPQLAPQLKGDAARLGIYRGNLTSAWRRALANAYPVLRKRLGQDAFDALARAYGRAHPAQDPDLNRFGAGLAAFIGAGDGPELPDLARLEWAVHESWYAPDAPAAADDDPRAVLASLSPQQFEASRAILHPSLRLQASRWATAAIWLAEQFDGPDAPHDTGRPSYALILRARWQVAVNEIDAAEYAALARLAEGERFGAAFDAAFDLDEEAPIAAWLDGWLKNGVLTGIVREVREADPPVV